MSTDISTIRADGQHEHPWQSTLVRVAVCWMIGIVLSDTLGGRVWWWLGAVAVVCVVVLIMAGLRRSRGVRTWACVAIVLLGAAWTVVRVHHIPGDHILRCKCSRPHASMSDGAGWSPSRALMASSRN
jgi:purine-cytosine permease-like protein